jgi:hypothetical protein
MHQHPGFNSDFIAVDDNGEDPFASQREEMEPAHSISEIKYGHVEGKKLSPNRKVKLDPQIKYAFVDKKGIPNMYELVDGQKYYRGIPRQVGVTLADGDLITYMDSDDFLLPNFLESIVSEFNKHPNLDFYSNGSWFDNHIATWPETNAMFPSEQTIKYQVPGLDSEWIITRMKPGMLTMAPWLFIHKKVDDIQWRDTIETSEDVDFNTRFRKKYKIGIQINNPSYVRCHYSQLWDY